MRNTPPLILDFSSTGFSFFFPWENAAWKCECALSSIEMDSFMGLLCLDFRNCISIYYRKGKFFQDAEADLSAFYQPLFFFFPFQFSNDMHLNIISKHTKQICALMLMLFVYALIIQPTQKKKIQPWVMTESAFCNVTLECSKCTGLPLIFVMNHKLDTPLLLK